MSTSACHHLEKSSIIGCIISVTLWRPCDQIWCWAATYSQMTLVPGCKWFLQGLHIREAMPQNTPEAAEKALRWPWIKQGGLRLVECTKQADTNPVKWAGYNNPFVRWVPLGCTNAHTVLVMCFWGPYKCSDWECLKTATAKFTWILFKIPTVSFLHTELFDSTSYLFSYAIVRL